MRNVDDSLARDIEKQSSAKQLPPRYIYVMGSGSGAGKSSICLGILAKLLTSGYSPEQLAYIKPMTQCLDKQPVTGFCERMRVACCGIGSLVYQKDFTKNFIDGLTPGANALRETVIASILHIANGKQVVIIDGIGDPSAGSVVGVSNADIALALPCRVIFVAKPGIGAAIDNTILCVSFLQNKGIKSIGLIYNKIPENGIPEIRKYIGKRINELLPEIPLLGFVTQNDRLNDPIQTANSEQLAQWFGNYLDLKILFQDWIER